MGFPPRTYESAETGHTVSVKGPGNRTEGMKGDRMMNSHNCDAPNRSIHCTVHSCAHHCDGEQYCSLESIQVGTHEDSPTQPECTDCMSFRVR